MHFPSISPFYFFHPLDGKVLRTLKPNPVDAYSNNIFSLLLFKRNLASLVTEERRHKR
jgi:hypothetical protein